MQRSFLYRSRTPVTLATAAWVITGLPAVAGAIAAVSYLASFFSGTGATFSQALTFAPSLVAPAGAVCTYVALRRSTTTRRAWQWSSLTMALLLVASAPLTVSFGQAALGEWCEGAPGGRGWSGGISSQDEVPVLCR